DYLELNDFIIDVDLTPNRGDCLSIQGLAREVALLTGSPYSRPTVPSFPLELDEQFPVQISDADLCPHYVGRIIRGIDMNAASPLWLRERLRRSGIRSIDAVVDVTNYVLLELGQPMHAFSLERLQGQVEVRRARAGESLTLLNGQRIDLHEGTPVISDDSGPLAMAGVMGGEMSAVHADTCDIFLESAFFAPLAMAGVARRYGLHTDSSHRFERGVDYCLQIQAIDRATELLLDIVGGKAGPLTELLSKDHLPPTETIRLRPERIRRVLGFEMTAAAVEDILTRLGLHFVATKGAWQVESLSHRYDLRIEEDLIEELGRVWGYLNIPSRMPQSTLKPLVRAENSFSAARMKQCWVDLDYQEIITYSFVDPKFQGLLVENHQALRLLNPISSDLSEMRLSLWPGLLKTLEHNLNRQHARVRLFEIGTCFLPGSDGLNEVQKLAGIICGPKDNTNWTGDRSRVDFFDLKGDIESFLDVMAPEVAPVFSQGTHSALHPGQTAFIDMQGQRLGLLGALHPALCKSFNVDGSIYLFELELSVLGQHRVPKFADISRFPAVRRDLALVVQESVAVGDLMSCIKNQCGVLLRDAQVFDVYAGKGINEGFKSIAIALHLQHLERTLSEEEVNEAVSTLLVLLSKEFNATLRE
ncbi:MAG TPA: phenylalanine--tRNA ligase subunit beta, partial [Pseudomonadales bacterium]|nr:phenylalanine--tRNA ligase subunit beta [Pseudomonadales bacterium]